MRGQFSLFVLFDVVTTVAVGLTMSRLCVRFPFVGAMVFGQFVLAPVWARSIGDYWGRSSRQKLIASYWLMAHALIVTLVVAWGWPWMVHWQRGANDLPEWQINLLIIVLETIWGIGLLAAVWGNLDRRFDSWKADSQWLTPPINPSIEAETKPAPPVGLTRWQFSMSWFFGLLSMVVMSMMLGRVVPEIRLDLTFFLIFLGGYAFLPLPIYLASKLLKNPSHRRLVIDYWFMAHCVILGYMNGIGALMANAFVLGVWQKLDLWCNPWRRAAESPIPLKFPKEQSQES